MSDDYQNDPILRLHQRRQEREFERIGKAIERAGSKDGEAVLRAFVREYPRGLRTATTFAPFLRGYHRKHPEQFAKPPPPKARSKKSRPKSPPAPARAPAPEPAMDFKPRPGETAEDRQRMKVAMARRLQELGVRTLPPEFAVNASDLAPERYRGDFQMRESQPMSPDARKALRQEQALRRAGVLGGGDVVVSAGADRDSGSGLGR